MQSQILLTIDSASFPLPGVLDFRQLHVDVSVGENAVAVDLDLIMVRAFLSGDEIAYLLARKLRSVLLRLLQPARRRHQAGLSP